ncbi:MAG TPA: cyclopropane-fatty-acyl-phospholipid synthase family protein [Hyphomicrobiaceae bacterium]|nr:cyclopropane-fatty-acyl-phospholipid synthase family protein [Hyphomicrobiaceae bacterium]
MLILLDVMLRRIVKCGDLTVIDARGFPSRYGDGTGRPVTARINQRRVEWRLLVDPQLTLGESYMTGALSMERGRIYELLELLLMNAQEHPLPTWARALDGLRYLLRRAAQFNPVGRARRNAAHHYDIDGAIYELFLDSDRQYSCAYFTPGADLEQAQLAKKRHLAAKLAIDPGQRLLDIGSGWGGLGLYLAKAAGCDVTGVTLSAEQHKVSNERAAREGLGRSVHFDFKDYRNIVGCFERIVSVGMFEHVGVSHYRTYFKKVCELLSDNGVALIHSIGRSDPPTVTNPFIAKYIFPGGYIPALSEIVAAVERSALIITDIEILRLHYAATLRAWRERFLANWDKAAAIRDETFCRMWEFYLAGSETAFRYQGLVVFQLQLSKRAGSLPLTRDYIYEDEQRLLAQETIKRRPRLAGE